MMDAMMGGEVFGCRRRQWIPAVFGLCMVGWIQLMAQEWTWIQTGGGLGNDLHKTIARDAQGNLLVAGSFEGVTQVGDQRLTTRGHRDALLARYTPEGGLIWAQSAGGTGEDKASGVAVCDEDHLAVLGTFRSATFTLGGLTLTNAYARDHNSVFVAKLDLNGRAVWLRQVNGAWSGGNGVGADAAGNVFIVANAQRFARFGETNFPSLYEDIIVAKYDREGGLAWARYGGSYGGYDYGYRIAVSPGGQVYAVGTFEDEAPFGDHKVTSFGSDDVFVTKYSPEGQVEWVFQGGGKMRDVSAGAAYDPEGGVIVTGSFTGVGTFGHVNIGVEGYTGDLFLLRLGPDGMVRWVNAIGDTLSESPGDVYANVTTDGQKYYTNLFCSGLFTSVLKAGTVTITNQSNLGGAQFYGFWDFDGQVRWLAQSGAQESALVADLAAAPNLFVAGSFRDLSFWGVTNRLAQGNSDWFFGRLSPRVAPIVDQRPAIVQAPVDANLGPGELTSFFVEASGSGGLTYRWRRDGADLYDDGRISGASKPMLLVNSVLTNDIANYTVVIRNSFGMVTSAVARLMVKPDGGAAGPSWNWVRSMGGLSSDAANAIAVSSDNWAYLTGSFQKTNLIGDDILVAPLNANNVFVAKYSRQGLPVWARQSTGTRNDTSTGLIVDSQGRPVVAGNFESGEIQFGGFTMTNRASGDTDGFLVKYTPDGDVQWAKSFGGTRDDEVTGLAIDQDDFLYLGGHFSSSRLEIGGTVLTNKGGTDLWLAKFRSDGELVWVRNDGYSGLHEVGAVAADSAGQVYLTGELWGRTRFGTNELDSHFDHDLLLAKFNRDGGFEWVRQLGNYSVVVGTALAVNPRGDVLVAGYFDQSFWFGGEFVLCRGGQDILLAKFNSLGDPLWARSYGGAGHEFPRRLLTGPAGAYYLCGHFEQTADFDGILLGSGSRDLFVAQVNEQGDVLWAKQAGGRRAESAGGIAVDSQGQLHLAGEFYGPSSFDGATYPSVDGTKDAFVAQLGPVRQVAPVRLKIVPPSMDLEIQGQVGSTVILQTTTQLSTVTSWQTLTNLVLTTSPLRWTDAGRDESKTRFYRAVSQP
jgi:hypothetical protein